MLNIVRNFIQSKIIKRDQDELFRKKLSDWYEAKDIKDIDQRIIVSSIRQGIKNPEGSFI